MTAGVPSVFSPKLSLPPTQAETAVDFVGAPFAAPLLKTLSAAAPPGWITAAMMVDNAPLLAGDRLFLGLDPDPLSLLPLTVQANGPSPDEIAAAFTRLLDARYRGRPWGQVLQNLYLTSCPACWRSAAAHAYRWQGYPPALMTRHVVCEFCGYDGEAVAEQADRALAAEALPGGVLQWEMMARVCGPGHALRDRAEHARGFYTPRNLWGIWQTLRILDDTSLSTGQRRALQWVMTLALWRGSNLAQRPETLWQPTLRRPHSFIERNLLVVMEEALAFVQQRSGVLDRMQIPRLDDKTMAEPGTFMLAQRRPPSLKQRIPPGHIGLALLSVPPPLPVYWLLRYAWSGWLFGEKAAAMLQDFLALRPGGGLILEQILAETVETLTAWLRPDGALLTQWRWRAEQDHSAAVLAGLPHFNGEIGVAQAAPGEWLALAVSAPERPPTHNKLDDIAAGAKAMRQFLAARGEPCTSFRLQPYILAAWRRRGDLPPPDRRDHLLKHLLDPADLPRGLTVLDGDGASWSAGRTPWWWLWEPPQKWTPASDRAEREFLNLPACGATRNPDDLAWRLAMRLPLIQTPDRPWIDALIASYCLPDSLMLRPQDEPERRRVELQTLAQHLVETGQRLGFDAAAWPEEDICSVSWAHSSERRAIFVLTATTALTPRVWLSRVPIPGLKRFLVLPGGRAGLVQWRIDHHPLWAAAAATGGWTFVKFRHLREMLDDPETDPDRWLAYLSLDPITADHAEQMRLL